MPFLSPAPFLTPTAALRDSMMTEPKQADLMQASESGMRRLMDYGMIIYNEFPDCASCFAETSAAAPTKGETVPGTETELVAANGTPAADTV
jgi:hypothetical protein